MAEALEEEQLNHRRLDDRLLPRHLRRRNQLGRGHDDGSGRRRIRVEHPPDPLGGVEHHHAFHELDSGDPQLEGLSDKIGRKNVLWAGAAGSAVMHVPMTWLPCPLC